MSTWMEQVRQKRLKKEQEIIKIWGMVMDDLKTAGTMQEEFERQKKREAMAKAGRETLEKLNKKDYAPSFADILKEMQELYDKKNHDYGNSFSETIQEFGFTPAIARINDKFKRVKQMVKKEQMLVDESMRDNLIDIANYCVLTIIELDRPF